MKKKFRKIFIFVTAFMIIGSFSLQNCKVYAAEKGQSTNPFDYTENSKERYVASIANKKGISYEQALSEENEFNYVSPLGAVDQIKYKTVDKVGVTFKSLTTSYPVRFALEVKYVYDPLTGAKEIISTGSPYAYISGISDGIFQHSDYNYDITDTKGRRISTTGSILFNSSSSVSVGGDIISVGSSSTYQYSSIAKTAVIEINTSDL